MCFKLPCGADGDEGWMLRFLTGVPLAPHSRRQALRQASIAASSISRNVMSPGMKRMLLESEIDDAG